MPKEECKLSSGCKHKERKPKKPHYIPRPFGKPYNYKCFQCPFTCMEKSHLYNHMKYSLCKNSLSLLIESDWAYKKGNLLSPDHLRLQQGIMGSQSSKKEKDEQKREEDLQLSLNDDAEEMELGDKDSETQAEMNGSTNPNSDPTNVSLREESNQEAELVMADMFSLEEQLLRARSVEVESKLHHYHLSKSHLLLSDSLACYPPVLPQGHLNCSDASPLNLSLLGVGYPLISDIFSYLNPSLSAATTSSTPQVSSLPFLASVNTHSDRTTLPTRLYYPFLCEHTTAADSSKTIKPRVYTPKLNLWKFPALRPASSQALSEAWGSTSSSETGHSAQERQPQWGQEQYRKKATSALDSHNAPAEKKSVLSFLPNQTTSTSTSIASDRLQLHNSLHAQARLEDTRSSSPQHFSEKSEVKDKETNEELFHELSSALQEVQRAEHEAALQPEHAHLRHLCALKIRKIRLELCHIQQALQRTTQGPLDLSIKRETIAVTTALSRDIKQAKQCVENSQDIGSEMGEEEEEEQEEGEMEEEWKKHSLEILMKMGQPHGISMVTSGIAMVKTELLQGEMESMWNSRTRKCEADSSVRLCSKTPICPRSPVTAPLNHS